MNTKTRSTILDAIYNMDRTFSQEDIRYALGKYRHTEKVDNSVGRFVRRLAENGTLKRTKNGFAMTAKGRKMIARQFA